MKMNNIKNFAALVIVGCSLLTISSCSDSYMEDVNTDKTKTLQTDPNGQLTTALLQTYGDFGLMDTYRSYITGFTQHFAGGWNVSKYAGSVHYDDDQARLIWDQYYTIAIKNLRDAIANSAEKPNLNAVLRIHRVYLMAVLTDTYGDVPCLSVLGGLDESSPTPTYDTQKDIYYWIFTELKACVDQLGTGNDAITGDVTNYIGNVELWKKYANSLRMRYAMRISDIEEEKAKSEFVAAYNDAGGYISSAKEDAYIKYNNSPFTYYDGAREYDFRVNALGEILYGQDPASPSSLICATMMEYLMNNNDPRLYKIARHYMNLKRSQIKPDKQGNVDLTQEVCDYYAESGEKETPCYPGYAWYSTNSELKIEWVSAAPTDKIPTLKKLVEQDPEAGYDKNNYPVRMMRPWLAIDFCQPDRAGILMTYAEVEFLLAEAASKKWIKEDPENHYKLGTAEAIRHINKYYLESDNVIEEAAIDAYVNAMAGKYDFTKKDKAREAINLQAWILHMMNPAEAWANLRRSDYPIIYNRESLGDNGDFTFDGDGLKTPTRLRYPSLESKYNTANYEAAVARMDGKDDWHKHVWWDTDDIHTKDYVIPE
jgi:hypothetical protein